MKFSYKQIPLEGGLLTFVIASNLIYIGSLFFSPSSVLLIASFASEAFYFATYQNRKSLNSIYRDCSPLFSLFKVFFLCNSTANIFVFVPFLLVEFYLLAFYRAGFYFKFLASALPCLNFKNFGLLNKLYSFKIELERYQNAIYIRPIVHLLLVISAILPPNYSLQGLVLLSTCCTLYFLKLLYYSLRYVYYITYGSYTKDLASHNTHHSPEVIVYVSGAPGSSYQLGQWIPVLEQLKERVTVMARQRFWITDLKDSPLHTVFARGLADIEKFITPDTKICLYPANAFKNTQMMRKTELKHIFINHGESDKIVNVSRLISAYTKLYLAGPLAKNRLEAASITLTNDQYTYVGRPQTSMFITNSPEKTGNILYAPTWEGFDNMSNYNSVRIMALALIKKIIQETEYNILFKPHPLTGTVKTELKNKLSQIQSYLEQSGRGRYIQKENILNAMNQCDIMITDISSVMNDFLATKKPYIVTNPSSIPAQLFEQKFQTVQGGHIISEVNEITNIIQDITQNDPKQGVREHLRTYSLGDFKCSALEKFKQEITNDCA